MATYTETIELVDNVSGPANAAAGSVRKASKSIDQMVGGLVSLGDSLGSLGGAFDQAAASVDRFGSSLASALGLAKELGALKLPAIKAPEGASSPVAPAPRPIAPPAAVGAAAAGAPASGPATAPVVPAPVMVPPEPPKLPPITPPPPIKIEADTVPAERQFKTLTSSLAAAQNAMTRAAAAGDQEGFAKAAAKVEMYKGALAQLPEGAGGATIAGKTVSRAMWDARNAMDVGRQSIGAAITGMKAAFSSLAQGDVKGTIAGITDAVAGMAKMLDLVVPGLGQIVSAIVSVAGGVAGAFASLVVGGAKFAVTASQAKQQSLSMWDALGGGVITGAEVDDMLSSLSDRIRISKDTLAPLTEEFLRMGITGKDALERVTLAAISAEATGKGGAAAFTDLQKRIALAAETGQGFKLAEKQLLNLRTAGAGVSEIAARMGMSTEALTQALAAGTVDAKKFGDAMTEAVIAKGAKPLERMASSFDSIKKKFDQDIGDLFEDIDVGPFMDQVKSLFSIFGQGTASGRALKDGIGGFFKEVFALATPLVPMIRNFLLDMVIWGLKAYIAIKPLAKAISDFFQSATGSKVLTAVLDGIWTAFKVVAVAIGVVVAIGATLVAWLVTAQVLFAAALGSVIAFGASIGSAISDGITIAKGKLDEIAAYLVSSWMSLKGMVSDFFSNAPQMASDFIQGLVNGIAGGASSIADAASGLAKSALSALTGGSGFDSHSPSKKTTMIGGFVGDGLAEGMDASAPDVYGAASSMAQGALSGIQSTPQAALGAGGAAAAAAPQASAPAASGGSTRTINIEKIEINGIQNAEEILEPHRLAMAMENAFELMGMMDGVA